jgi:hypothetical protein
MGTLLMETIVFEAQVSARDGRPFVKMTCTLADGTPVFAAQFLPSVVTALGLRAIQSAIEAERDAGLIAFLQSLEMPGEAVNGMLVGLRDHREQFDADSGTMRPIADDDPSSLS